jgi:glycosyltransferase involved in cell wall biosynthesis
VTRAVHQVIVGASPGDAITSMALAARSAFRVHFRSELFAYFVDPRLSDEVHRLSDLEDHRATKRDLLVYHSSYGIPDITDLMLARPESLVLVYHNLTPSSFFARHAPELALGLEWGRRELELIRHRVVLAVADSNFNAVDLRRYGYETVHVVPAGLEPHRLRAVAADATVAAEVRSSFPEGYILSVSQVLPHKRMELLIGAAHLLRWVHNLDLGLVIVGSLRAPHYAAGLESLARQVGLQRFHLAGGVSDAALAAYYRLASVFATTSAHEGLALPPLEALSFGVPVVAPAIGALPENLLGAALLLPENSGPMVTAEALAEAAVNAELRTALQRAGWRRLAEIEARKPAEALVGLTREVLR